MEPLQGFSEGFSDVAAFVPMFDETLTELTCEIINACKGKEDAADAATTAYTKLLTSLSNATGADLGTVLAEAGCYSWPILDTRYHSPFLIPMSALPRSSRLAGP